MRPRKKSPVPTREHDQAPLRLRELEPRSNERPGRGSPIRVPKCPSRIGADSAKVLEHVQKLALGIIDNA